MLLFYFRPEILCRHQAEEFPGQVRFYFTMPGPMPSLEERSSSRRPLTPPPPYQPDAHVTTSTVAIHSPSSLDTITLDPHDVKSKTTVDPSLITVPSSGTDATDSPDLQERLSKKEVTKNYFLDFCYFPDDYDQRIARYPDVQLKRQEAIKTRMCYSSLCSIISGTAFAVPSHGASAVICLWAARRWYVASKKPKYIKAELSKRKVELRAFLHRDWIIPASVAITCIAVGFGCDFGLASAVPLGGVEHSVGGGGLIVPHEPGGVTQGLQHAFHLQANNVADPMLQNTSGHFPVDPRMLHGVENSSAEWTPAFQSKLHMVASNWAHGFKDQFQSLFSPVHHAIASGMTPDQTYEGAVAWIFGAHSAQILEKEIAVLLSQQVIQQMCERLDYESIMPRYNHNSTCRSLPWAVDTICSRCETGISKGKYYHCCKCPGDEGQVDEEFNLCLKCHEGSPECEDPKHSLQKRQTAMPGRFLIPRGKTTLMRDIAGPAKLSCSSCTARITRGWHYGRNSCDRNVKPQANDECNMPTDCLQCWEEKKRYTLCLRCYETGTTCVGDQTHSFYAFSRAKFASYSQDTPYQKRKGQAETGRASCSECHARILKGAYYRESTHTPPCGLLFFESLLRIPIDNPRFNRLLEMQRRQLRPVHRMLRARRTLLQQRPHPREILCLEVQTARRRRRPSQSQGQRHRQKRQSDLDVEMLESQMSPARAQERLFLQ